MSEIPEHINHVAARALTTMMLSRRLLLSIVLSTDQISATTFITRDERKRKIEILFVDQGASNLCSVRSDPSLNSCIERKKEKKSDTLIPKVIDLSLLH